MERCDAQEHLGGSAGGAAALGAWGQTVALPDYGRNRLHSKHLQTQVDHAVVSESGRFGMSAYSASAAVPPRRQSLRLRLQGLVRDGGLRRAGALGRLPWGCGSGPGSANVSLAVGCVPRPTASRVLSRGSKGGRNVFGGTPNTASETVALPGPDPLKTPGNQKSPCIISC